MNNFNFLADTCLTAIICHNWRCLSESTCFIPIFFFRFDNLVNKKKSRIKSTSVDQLNMYIQGKLSRSDSELHAAQTKKGAINKRPEVT